MLSWLLDPLITNMSNTFILKYKLIECQRYPTSKLLFSFNYLNQSLLHFSNLIQLVKVTTYTTPIATTPLICGTWSGEDIYHWVMMKYTTKAYHWTNLQSERSSHRAPERGARLPSLRESEVNSIQRSQVYQRRRVSFCHWNCKTISYAQFNTAFYLPDTESCLIATLIAAAITISITRISSLNTSISSSTLCITELPTATILVFFALVPAADESNLLLI